jgi:hypothetical protein
MIGVGTGQGLECGTFASGSVSAAGTSRLRQGGGRATRGGFSLASARIAIREGFTVVAGGSAAYRRRRAELRRAGQQPAVVDDLKLGLGAVAVLAERYLLRDERGRVTESTGE